MIKKILLTTFIGVGILSNSYAQDKIHLKNNELPIEVKVIEISQSEIKYKKYNNQDGPTYIASKNEITKIEFENGDIETFEIINSLQKSTDLNPNSKIYLQYTEIEKKNNVDKDDVLTISRNEFLNLTKCNLVNSKEDADFVIEIQVYKYMITKRKAKFTIKHSLTNKTIYESEWFKGAPSEFNGFSGSRQAIGRVIKKSLLNIYPEIAK